MFIKRIKYCLFSQLRSKKKKYAIDIMNLVNIIKDNKFKVIQIEDMK